MLAAIGSSGRTTGPPPITDEILPPSPMQLGLRETASMKPAAAPAV